MNRLVANLLDMTRLEARAMKVTQEPGDVQDVVGVALAELTDELQDRPVTVDIPADLPLVSIDFVLISRVLINLLDNAIAAIDGDGEVVIDISYDKEHETVRIEVADNGKGIPPEHRMRLFEPYFSTKKHGRVLLVYNKHSVKFDCCEACSSL